MAEPTNISFPAAGTIFTLPDDLRAYLVETRDIGKAMHERANADEHIGLNELNDFEETMLLRRETQSRGIAALMGFQSIMEMEAAEVQIELVDEFGRPEPAWEAGGPVPDFVPYSVRVESALESVDPRNQFKELDPLNKASVARTKLQQARQVAKQAMTAVRNCETEFLNSLAVEFGFKSYDELVKSGFQTKSRIACDNGNLMLVLYPLSDAPTLQEVPEPIKAMLKAASQQVGDEVDVRLIHIDPDRGPVEIQHDGQGGELEPDDDAVDRG